MAVRQRSTSRPAMASPGLTLVEVVVAAAIVLLVVTAASSTMGGVSAAGARAGGRDAAEAAVASELAALRGLPFAAQGPAAAAVVATVFPHADPAAATPQSFFAVAARDGCPAGTFFTVRDDARRSADRGSHLPHQHVVRLGAGRCRASRGFRRPDRRGAARRRAARASQRRLAGRHEGWRGDARDHHRRPPRRPVPSGRAHGRAVRATVAQPRDAAGFSLVELLVAVVVAGVVLTAGWAWCWSMSGSCAAACDRLDASSSVAFTRRLTSAELGECLGLVATSSCRCSTTSIAFAVPASDGAGHRARHVRLRRRPPRAVAQERERPPRRRCRRLLDHLSRRPGASPGMRRERRPAGHGPAAGAPGRSRCPVRCGAETATASWQVPLRGPS